MSRHWKLCKHDQRRSITGCGVHLQARKLRRNARNRWVLICANPWCPDRWLWTQGPLWCRRPSSVFMQHLPQTRIHNTRLNNSQHSRPSLLNPAQPCWHNTVQHPLSPQHNSLAASSSPFHFQEPHIVVEHGRIYGPHSKRAPLQYPLSRAITAKHCSHDSKTHFLQGYEGRTQDRAVGS